MTQFDFTTAPACPASADRLEEIAGVLYGGRCDDTSVHSDGPTVLVTFHRRADAFDAAVRSAVEDLRAEGFEVERVEIDRDDRAPLLSETPAAPRTTAAA